MSDRSGLRMTGRHNEAVFTRILAVFNRVGLKRPLKLESLEERRVMDSALSAEWTERTLYVSQDQPAVESSIETRDNEMIDRIISRMGLGRMVSYAGEMSYDLAENSDLGDQGYSLRVGDLYWDMVMEDGEPTLIESENRFHNDKVPADINGDDYVNAIDALVAINTINQNGGAMMLPSRGEGALMQNMLDANGDRWVSAIDALFVINRLGGEIGGGSGFDNGSGSGSDNGSGSGSDNGSGSGRDDGSGSGSDDGSGQGGSDGETDSGAAVDDFLNKFLPQDAVSFPSAEIDVLENDVAGYTILELGGAALGTVELVLGGGPAGRDTVRYIPGSTFRGNDSFLYTIANSAGDRSTARVSVSYYQEELPFQVMVPEEIEGRPGESIRFVDGDGNPLIFVVDSGSDASNVGV